MDDTVWSWPPDAAAVAAAPLAAGELPVAWAAAVGPVGECRVVLWAWRHNPVRRPSTIARLGELAARFARRVDAGGCRSLLEATAGDAAGFVSAPTRRGTPPALHTMHLRRTALRALYRTLHDLHPHGAVSDPTVFLALPARGPVRQRPLTNPELARVHAAADPATRPVDAVVVALAASGATTAEITLLRRGAVDLAAGTLVLPGVARVRARTVALPPWAATALTDTAAPPPDALLVGVGVSPPGSQAAQAGVSNRLRRVLRRAGLTATPGVGPRSLRLWAAAETHRRTGSLDAAAAVLGATGRDHTATALRLPHP